MCQCHYLYCPDAAVDPSTGEPTAPCSNVVFTPATSAETTAAAASAAAGPGMLLVGQVPRQRRVQHGGVPPRGPGRAVGVLRVRQGGNAYTTCTNLKVGSPDTFCYHNVCAACTADR
ncbi:hypothetical protein ACCO45_013431 [Purpureocillium lilacinum]|uniref:Uncharacterized protein n=1 Tax=Purpureocillium lilacinum TaxID=33203 RepID=A0ACC4D7E5_PURLI